MNQERKKALAARVAQVVPKDWKYTLAVRNHSTIVMTITQAPKDLVASYREMRDSSGPFTNWSKTDYSCKINTHYPGQAFHDPDLCKIMTDIVEALNYGNHDNSDAQTDYFDVGWYVDVQVGSYDSPFIHVLKSAHEKYYGVKKAPKNNVPSWKLKPYLPYDFALLSPGKKAAATKKALQLIAQNGEA
jgi:hypothetical protein